MSAAGRPTSGDRLVNPYAVQVCYHEDIPAHATVQSLSGWCKYNPTIKVPLFQSPHTFITTVTRTARPEPRPRIEILYDAAQQQRLVPLVPIPRAAD